MILFLSRRKLSQRAFIDSKLRKESLIMDESSQHKQKRVGDQSNNSKSLEIASKLIESGDSAQLRQMLTNGELSDVNVDNGKRLLVAASEAGQLGCLRVLMNHLDSSTERSASDYQSCGTAYVTRGKHRFMKISLPIKSGSKSGAAPTESLVLVACHRRYHHTPHRYYKDYEIAEIEPDAIMSKYIYVDISNLFMEACKRNDIEQVEYLISMGADVNRVDYHGRNAALLACAYGNVKLMEVLLKNGTDPNTRVRYFGLDLEHDGDDDGDYDDADSDDAYFLCDGDALLHIACPNDLPMMKLLLEYGADVNALDGDFRSAFYKAYHVKGTSREVINLLVDYIFKTPTEHVKFYCHHPLHLACSLTDYPLVERILQLGVDVNAVDMTTPLIRMFRNVKEWKWVRTVEFPDLARCTKLLLDYGADPTIQDEEGKSVFDYIEPGSELEALLREDRKPVLK